MKCPVTYFPIDTQRQFQINKRRIAGKPYAKYFNGDLWLHDEVLPALAAPMDPAQALAPEEINRLLDPGYLPGETGYCVLPDGSAYVASKVPFKGVPIEAFRWWWWWHSVESERYTLWYPHNHVSAERADRDKLTAPGLSDEDRYVPSTHKVVEYIGPRLVEIYIDFVDPSEMGLDMARARQQGVVHGCAWVRLQKPDLRFVRMAHLARPTADGFELRSRYWIARDLRLTTPFGRIPVPARALSGLKGSTKRLMSAAYEQLLHDQIEFTHLSTFLAEIHAEFGGA